MRELYKTSDLREDIRRLLMRFGYVITMEQGREAKKS
jgi:hypothetical protein